VKIIYIDNNEAIGRVFCQVASEVANVQCMAISDARKSVIHFIESETVPEFIFINCSLKDVPCRSLVEFIRKQEHLSKTKIVVIADYFTKRDLKNYTTIGVNHFSKSTGDTNELRKMLSGTFNVSSE
jgi:two-component SAPR family response regulator